MIKEPKMIPWEELKENDSMIKIGKELVEGITDSLSSKTMYPHDGLLLTGPRGSGKTSFALILSSQLAAKGCTVFEVRETKNVEWPALFEAAHKRAPSVIFIDECHSVLGESQTASVPSFAKCWSKPPGEFKPDMPWVLVLAASNQPDKIHPDILDRLGTRYEFIPLPDEQRVVLLKAHFFTMPTSLTEEDWKALLPQLSFNNRRLCELTLKVNTRVRQELRSGRLSDRISMEDILTMAKEMTSTDKPIDCDIAPETSANIRVKLMDWFDSNGLNSLFGSKKEVISVKYIIDNFLTKDEQIALGASKCLKGEQLGNKTKETTFLKNLTECMKGFCVGCTLEFNYPQRELTFLQCFNPGRIVSAHQTNLKHDANNKVWYFTHIRYRSISDINLELHSNAQAAAAAANAAAVAAHAHAATP